MKRNLLLAGLLLTLAAIAIVVVIMLPGLQDDDAKPQTVKPETEHIVQAPKKEEPRPPKVPAKKEPIVIAKAKEPKQSDTPVEKKVEPTPKKIDTPTEPKVEPKKIEEKKTEPAPKKVEPKVEAKKQPAAKVIALGDDLIKLNDEGGEYTLKPMYRGIKVKVIGVIKTLKIAGGAEGASLDASGLLAEEVIFTGDLNSGAKVLLGKAKKLTIRNVNDKSEVDASACEAREIIVAGSLNSRGVVKLHAPEGKIEFVNQVNDSRVEIVAPDGKIVFKSTGSIFNSHATVKLSVPGGSVEIAGQVNHSQLDIDAAKGKVILTTINADSQITVAAKDVEVRGAINGNQTQVTVTLTAGGSLKFRTLNSEGRLHWRKAEAGDPDPRIDAGMIGARAQFRMLPALKK
jgi:hypothetical protein